MSGSASASLTNICPQFSTFWRSYIYLVMRWEELCSRKQRQL